jgi:hypothetical protein
MIIKETWSIDFNNEKSNGYQLYPLNETIHLEKDIVFIISSMEQNADYKINITESPLNGTHSNQFYLIENNGTFTVVNKNTVDQIFNFRVVTCQDYRSGSVSFSQTFSDIGNYSVSWLSTFSNTPLVNFTISNIILL